MNRDSLYRKTMELVYGFSNPDSTRVLGPVSKPLSQRYVTPVQKVTPIYQPTVTSNAFDALRNNAIKGDVNAIQALTNISLNL